MDTAIKAALVYFILLVLMRLAGRRTLAEVSTFDFILLLIIGGTTQRSLLGQDYSVTNALIVVVTLVLIDVVLSLVERDHPTFAKLVNGSPLIVVEDGRLLPSRMRWSRISESEILAAARRKHGIERLDDIKFAILEATGDISIIPATKTARS